MIYAGIFFLHTCFLSLSKKRQTSNEKKNKKQGDDARSCHVYLKCRFNWLHVTNVTNLAPVMAYILLLWLFTDFVQLNQTHWGFVMWPLKSDSNSFSDTKVPSMESCLSQSSDLWGMNACERHHKKHNRNPSLSLLRSKPHTRLYHSKKKKITMEIPNQHLHFELPHKAESNHKAVIGTISSTLWGLTLWELASIVISPYLLKGEIS